MRQLESLRTKFRMRQTQTQLSRLNLVLPLLRLEIEFVCAPRIGWSARQMTISETEKRVLWMTPSKRAISGPSQWSNRLTSTQSRRRRVSEEKLGANWFCRDDLLCQSERLFAQNRLFLFAGHQPPVAGFRPLATEQRPPARGHRTPAPPTTLV